MLKAIIFDMDGVIADTEPIYHIVTDDLLREHGIVTADDYQDQFIGVTSEFMWTTIVNEFHLPLTPEECIRIIDKKRAEIEKTDGLHPLPNVIDLIKRLYDHGYPLAGILFRRRLPAFKTGSRGLFKSCKCASNPAR